jgi:hypothetical protein
MNTYTKRLSCGCIYTSHNVRVPPQKWCAKHDDMLTVQLVGVTDTSAPNLKGEYTYTRLDDPKAQRRRKRDVKVPA